MKEICPKLKEVMIIIDNRLVKLDICEDMLKPSFDGYNKHAHNPICNLIGKKPEECRFNKFQKGS